MSLVGIRWSAAASGLQYNPTFTKDDDFGMHLCNVHMLSPYARRHNCE